MAWRYDQARIDARRAEIDEQRRLEEEEYFANCSPSWGVCYFFGCDEGLVKIGYTRHLNQRLNNLRSEHGLYKHRLLATALGGYDREQHYHRMFAAHRFSGEWFNRCPEIEAEIAKLNTPPSRPSSRGWDNRGVGV